MPKTETLNLRVSAEFKSKLVEEAKKEKRSVTNYLEATLTKIWKTKSSPRKVATDIKEHAENSNR